MGFSPISPFKSLLNGQQKTSLLNGAKDGLKSVTCQQTLISSTDGMNVNHTVKCYYLCFLLISVYFTAFTW